MAAFIILENDGLGMSPPLVPSPKTGITQVGDIFCSPSAVEGIPHCLLLDRESRYPQIALPLSVGLSV